MIRSSRQRDPELDAEVVLDALADPDCRRILERLDEPRTAAEIVRACDIPRSTVYRKIDAMVDTGLLAESTIIDTHGRNSSQYYLDVSRIEISLTDTGSLSVAISESPAGSERRSTDPR